MDSLRNEIVEAQKKRIDLIKWKLLLVATLGATGLGFTGSKTIPNAGLVLCCIPFVCAYVDFLCRNLSLRVVVIGVFLSIHFKDDPELENLRKYELFLKEIRREIKKKPPRFLNEHGLESTVISWSSYLFSLALIIYSIVMWIKSEIDLYNIILIMFSGLLGIFLTYFLNKNYRFRCKVIESYDNSIE